MAASPQQQPPVVLSSQSQQNMRLRLWILELGICLIAIATAIWIKSWLLSSQSPTATVMAIIFVAVGVIFSLYQVIFPGGLEFQPPIWLLAVYGKSGLVKFINVSIPVIGIIGIMLTLIPFPPIPNPIPIPSPTKPTPEADPTPTVPFAVYPNYDPSGEVGDIGDITVVRLPNLVRFIYTVKGQPPHQWDYTYLDGKLNSDPSKFAGVFYLNPPNNWGKVPGGFDLRGRHKVIWQAHSLSGSVHVEFVIGGVTWKWDDKTQTQVAVPYPDSLQRTSLGTQKLTPLWQTFSYDLSTLPKDSLRDVLGGFGWIINWASNAVQGIGPGQPQTFTIEIKGIAYV